MYPQNVGFLNVINVCYSENANQVNHENSVQLDKEGVGIKIHRRVFHIYVETLEPDQRLDRKVTSSLHFIYVRHHFLPL